MFCDIYYDLVIVIDVPSCVEYELRV